MSMGQYILAFDLGTGGNKASIYDVNGNCLGSSFKSYKTFYPRPGWHEQQPEDWWKAVVCSTGELLKKSAIKKENIRCLAISGHSMAVVPIDKKGRLLRSCIPIWSDTRARKQAEKFFNRINYLEWYQITGNGFSKECYAVFKIMWYQDNEPNLFKNIFKVIGTKDYINYKLTGRILTDNSYASGSGVYDLKNRKYKREFIEASGLPAKIFPEIVFSHTMIGTILPEVASGLGLSQDLTVMAGGVDNSCMALGAGNITEGKVYLSLGSSAWIAISSKRPVIDIKIKPFVFDHVIPGLYTSATSIFSAGSSLQWLKEIVCSNYIKEAKRSGKNVYELLIEEAMKSPIGSNGVLFNPSLAGAPAAYAAENVKGAFLGLELMHSQSDIIRAVIEGITMDLCIMYKKLEKLCPLEKEITIVGGGSKNPSWRQVFADIFNIPFIKINIDQDAASLGATTIAAVGMGLWKDYNKVKEIIRKEETIKPIAENVEKYKIYFSVYCRILKYLSEIGNIIESSKIKNGY